MARVEWSEAELNATVGELSGGNPAARGFQVDVPRAIRIRPLSRLRKYPRRAIAGRYRGCG